MPHRTFRQIPASHPYLMQPTLNPSPYQPAPFLHSPGQRLVGIHSRKVCRGVSAVCSPSAGIKSGNGTKNVAGVGDAHPNNIEKKVDLTDHRQ